MAFSLEQDPFSPKSWWRWPVLSLPLPVLVLLFLSWLISLGYIAQRWYSNHDQLISVERQFLEQQKVYRQVFMGHEMANSFFRVDDALCQVVGQKLKPIQRYKLSQQLWKESRAIGFDPLIIVAVMYSESRSNPWARGKLQSGTESGALGLMQLKLSTAQQMGDSLGLKIETEQDMLKPEVNLLLGTHYLLRQIAEHKDLMKGLWAYNIGPGELRRRLRTGEPLPIRYSTKILAGYKKLLRAEKDGIGRQNGGNCRENPRNLSRL